MPEQFENPLEKKLDEAIVPETPAAKIELIADKAAEKSTKAVQKFDKDNAKLFSK
jgi:hypothetical protein